MIITDGHIAPPDKLNWKGSYMRLLIYTSHSTVPYNTVVHETTIMEQHSLVKQYQYYIHY